MLIDALGLPLEFEITEGQRHHSLLVGLGVFACTFCDVEHNRRGTSTELIAKMTAPPGQRLDDFVGKDEKIQSQVVNVEPFVIQQQAPYRRLSSGS